MPFFLFLGKKNSGARHNILTPHNPKKPIENNLIFIPLLELYFKFCIFLYKTI